MEKPTPKRFNYAEEEVCSPRSSTETYASTVSSVEDDFDQGPTFMPPLRRLCRAADAVPATPADFAELFPSTRRILIQHDDTTPDGNLNLRLDTVLTTSRGRKTKITLFHLRMTDLADRKFSLRRYCRDSGREVCNSRRKYLKPAPSPPQPSKRPLLKRSWTSALSTIGLKSLRVRSLSESSHDGHDEPEAELEGEEEGEDELKMFTAQSGIDATIPTDTIRLEFSNYAQVEVHRGRNGEDRVYEFEYWGEQYAWRRDIYREDGDLVLVFDLLHLASAQYIAHIITDKLSPAQARCENIEGSWVPPCSLRITRKRVSEDLGDVIVATGLMALTDDCIRRCWHETCSTQPSTQDYKAYSPPGRLTDPSSNRRGHPIPGR